MQEPTISTNGPTVAKEQGNRPAAKPYHTPTFTRLGKVEQLTGQTTRPMTTTRVTTISKSGRAS